MGPRAGRNPQGSDRSHARWTPGTSRAGLAFAVAVALTACDFDVINPGPTPDDRLDNEAAHQAVTNGAARQFFDALNEVSYTTSAVTRETFPAGSTSSFGISIDQQSGRLTYDDEHVSWTNLHEARAIAEDGVERFERVLGERGASIDGYGPAAEAALWAGYANRLLGANWCEAALNGGPIVTSTEVLERAEQWFTRAIALATGGDLADIRTAAMAGRASVRVQLGDWSGAVSDAGAVSTDFEFNAEYHDAQQSQYNRIFFAGADEPYRAVTVWNTVYEDYYTETDDPRTRWEDTGMEGDASVGLVGGRVPFFRQLKHAERGADIRLSSGHEMRLIEAEALLRSGDWQGAIEIVNSRRTALGVDPWSPANETEAWTALKRERGIELWLEGRRMADLRRWRDEGTPGELDPLERAGHADSFLSAEQSVCYQIPKDERESNPNIPLLP